jgi:aspartokinase
VLLDIESKDRRTLLQVTERLERARLTFFQVASQHGETRFAIRPPKYRDVERIVATILAEHGMIAEINASDFALVSVVGEALRGRLDKWHEQAKESLADNRIEVLGSARDAISLSYLVSEEQRKKAVGLLHKSLVL